MSTRLERSTTNRVIAGVCGGVAEYLQIDPTLVRVFFVIAAVMTAGLGFLAYLVLIVLMPLPGHPQPFVQSATTPAAPPAAGSASDETMAMNSLTTPAAPAPPDPAATERRRATFGYFLVALGVVFFLANLGAFRIVRWDYIWPLVFIAAGAWLLAGRIRR